MACWVRVLFVSGAPVESDPASEEHRRHVAELRSRGKLRLAGEFANGDGFLEILEVRDRREAEALCAESPLVERGLCSWILREWIEATPAPADRPTSRVP